LPQRSLGWAVPLLANACAARLQYAWALAQLDEANAALACIREAEQLIERQASSNVVAGHDGAYHALGRAALLGRLDEAQSLGQRSMDPPVERACPGPAGTHCDSSRAVRCGGEAYFRRVLELAAAWPTPADCELPARLWHALPHDRKARARTPCPKHAAFQDLSEGSTTLTEARSTRCA
jgi:hypothetical protein